MFSVFLILNSVTFIFSNKNDFFEYSAIFGLNSYKVNASHRGLVV